MILINRILSKLGLLPILMALPLNLSAVTDVTVTLKDLTTSRKVGQDNALYFIKAFSQELPDGKTKEQNKWISLNTLYKDAYAALPRPSNQNGIWLNEQGKVLYRTHKGNHCSCLFLFDIATEKHSEIARFHNVRQDAMPPYRLNNKNEIFYFDHSAKDEWIGKIRFPNGHEETILDSQKFEQLGDPYRLGYEDFLNHFGIDMLKGSSKVFYNDLGQVLFASGTLCHHTWLLDPKHPLTRLWDLPHQVLGLNRSGDIFLHSALSKSAIYHTAKRSLFVFDTKHTSHEYVVANRLRSVIFPADQLCDPFAGVPHLCLAGDHVRAVESFEGHKLFFQHLNDKAEGVGFGALSLLSPQFKPGYIKGFMFSVNDGVRELQDFAERRSAILGINNGGTVVGFAEGISGQLHAFMKTSNKLVNLGLLFPDTSLALDINDQNWTLGIYKDEKGLFQGFLYHPNKGVVNIAQGLNDHYATSFNIPLGFNEKGQVIGMLYFFKDEAFHRTPFAFDPEVGRAVHLPHYPHEEVNL